jgi:hypothetical protein
VHRSKHLALPGRLALALALLETVACVKPGRSATSEAELQFSQSVFCPRARVAAGRLVTIPTPPPEIEIDPERRAMWRATYERRALADPRQTIAASGCGHETVYACWTLVGREWTGRHVTVFDIGSSCIEASGDDLEAQTGP